MKRLLMNSFIVSLILIGLFPSCCTVPKVPPKEALQQDILTYGDTNAYNKLRFYYFDEDLLPYSIFMADKYQYGKACSEIYNIMDDCFRINNIEFDSATCQYILYYLRKGIELKDESCAMTLCDAYLRGKMVDVDTVRAKQCLMKVFPEKKVENIYWPHLMKRCDKR